MWLSSKAIVSIKIMLVERVEQWCANTIGVCSGRKWEKVLHKRTLYIRTLGYQMMCLMDYILSLIRSTKLLVDDILSMEYLIQQIKASYLNQCIINCSVNYSLRMDLFLPNALCTQRHVCPANTYCTPKRALCLQLADLLEVKLYAFRLTNTLNLHKTTRIPTSYTLSTKKPCFSE